MVYYNIPEETRTGMCERVCVCGPRMLLLALYSRVAVGKVLRNCSDSLREAVNHQRSADPPPNRTPAGAQRPVVCTKSRTMWVRLRWAFGYTLQHNSI